MRRKPGAQASTLAPERPTMSATSTARIARVDRDGDGAEPRAGEIEDRIGRHVGQPQRHAIARPDAEIGQALRGTRSDCSCSSAKEIVLSPCRSAGASGVSSARSRAGSRRRSRQGERHGARRLAQSRLRQAWMPSSQARRLDPATDLAAPSARGRWPAPRRLLAFQSRHSGSPGRHPGGRVARLQRRGPRSSTIRSSRTPAPSISPVPETDRIGRLARKWGVFVMAQAKARHEDWPNLFFNVGFVVDPDGVGHPEALQAVAASAVRALGLAARPVRLVGGEVRPHPAGLLARRRHRHRPSRRHDGHGRQLPRERPRSRAQRGGGGLSGVAARSVHRERLFRDHEPGACARKQHVSRRPQYRRIPSLSGQRELRSTRAAASR